MTSINWSRYQGYILIAAAVFMMWLADVIDTAPSVANHRLLVASTAIEDERFRHTVILVLYQRFEGAFGLVLNRPGKEPHEFVGGPVGTDDIYVLHSLDVTFPKTVVLKDLNLGVMQGSDAAQAIAAAAKKPKWYGVFHGFSGWGRRQLNFELRRGDWRLVKADSDLMEHASGEGMWERARDMPALPVK